MQAEIGSLNNYPYISYKDYKTEAFNFESASSTNLIWNVKCSLKCRVNNQVMIIPSNTIILLDKGNSFSCQPNTTSQIKMIEFNTEVFQNSLISICGFINKNNKKVLKNKTILFFTNEETSLITNTFLIIKELVTDGLLVNIEELNSAICSLLQNALKEKFAHDAKHINCFGELLNSQYNIFHNVSDYAAQLCICLLYTSPSPRDS